MKNNSLKEAKEKVTRKKSIGKPQNKIQHCVSANHTRKKKSRAHQEVRGVLSDNESNVQSFQNSSADLSIPDMIEKSFNEDSNDISSSTSNIEYKKCGVFNTSTPWRVCASNNSKPRTFIVKDKSFIPSYEQDMIIDSSVCSHTSVEYPNQQTSILDYVDDSKRSLNSTLFISPRKSRDVVDAKQSSPSPIASIETEQGAKGQTALFSFSSDENDENCDPALVIKTKAKKRKKSLVYKAVLKDLQPTSDDDECQQSIDVQERSKEEDEELEKLAAHYNSMFEEIDQHDLYVDT